MSVKALLYTNVVALALAALASGAQTQDYSYDNGYIRFVDGDVSLQRAQNPEPEPGEINVPVLPGDRLWTSGKAFVEIRLADGTEVRLGEDTKVDFMTFGAEPNLRLWNGSVVVTTGDHARIRIDTPEGSVYQQSPGSHRVDVNDNTTTVTVFDGVAELGSERNTVLIDPGQRSVLETGGDPSNPFTFDASTGDTLDARSREREPPRRREVPLTEASGEVHHYVDDLDGHGSWSEDEEYGSVWYPRVTTTWAPYRDGRWSYTSYGYTWVSYEPWGWAPYHYGRWGYNHRGWYWVPGRQWSPAWVSFAVGPAWIGWSPLGYHGGAVFGYGNAYYGRGSYPSHRRNYRGGKAVPRHVYDNGAGWNFSKKDQFRRGGRARLRASDVRSTSARARVANQAAVLDRSFTPRSIDHVRQRAPRAAPFSSRTTARTTPDLGQGRARARGSRAAEAPWARTQTLRSAGAVSTSPPEVARERNPGRTRIPTRATIERATPNRTPGRTETRSRSRVFQSQGTRTEGARTPTSSTNARRRTIPTRNRVESTQPEPSSPSRSGAESSNARPRNERRTRGQDYFESSTRRETVTRSRSEATRRTRSSSPASERASSNNRSRSQRTERAAPSNQRGSDRSRATGSGSRTPRANGTAPRTRQSTPGVSRSQSRERSSAGRSSGRARTAGSRNRNR